MAECPYKPGDVVVYRPSSRGEAMVLHTSFSSLVPGKAYTVAQIVKDDYVVPKGFEGSETGGLHWTEFQPSHVNER